MIPGSPTASADARITTGHPFRRHLARVESAEDSEAHLWWRPEDGPLPTLYICHGIPMLVDDAAWMAELHDWVRCFPRPRAIVMVSAHWESAPAAISSTSAHTPLVYDFGGLHPFYYQLQYSTPDASELGRKLQAVLSDVEAVQETGRGLDHGAWVPLKAMYPAADIPVVQLSLPTTDPQRLVAIGERLRKLRYQGVLVIGSGFMTHGQAYIDHSRPDVVPAWSAEFDAWAAQTLATGDLDELMRYAAEAPGLPYAHPTAEHFLPIFVALGAASDPGSPAATVIDGYMMGLSRRSVQID